MGKPQPATSPIYRVPEVKGRGEQLRRKSDSCNSRAWVCPCILMCAPVSECLSATGSLLLEIRYSRMNFGPPDATSHCLRRKQLARPYGRVEPDVGGSRALACLLRESHLPIAEFSPPAVVCKATVMPLFPQAHLCSVEKPHVSPEREVRGER